MGIKCWASHYCKQANTNTCNEFCDAHIILKALYSQSNMPRRYQFEKPLRIDKSDPDIKVFTFLNKFKEEIVEHVEDGEGLYLWSRTTGNGKTTWACKMMNHYFRKIAFTSGLEFEGVYVNVPTFLEQLRESYDNSTPEFETLKEQVQKAKLLIMDDIGSEKPSEWVKERLYTIINTRDNNGLCTIYTSNLPLEEIRENLGVRIESRIRGASTIIELKGKDKRGVEL